MNMNKLYLPAIFLVQAITVNADSFTDVTNEIVGNNLSVKYNIVSDASKIEAMRGENTLEPPEVGFEHLWGAHGVGNKWNFSVSQSFDWPGVYAARREAIRSASAAMQFIRESDMIDVRMEVRLAIIDIIYTRQKINAIKELSISMGNLVESYRIAVENGTETRLDYNKAVLEKIDVDKELKSLEGEYAVLVSSLETLNGGKDVGKILEEIGDQYPKWSLAELVPNPELIKERDPQYAAAMASIDLARAQEKVEKLALFPGFSVGYVHEWEQGEKYNGLSFGMTLPFLYGSHKKKTAALDAEAMMLESEMKMSQRMGELTGVYKQAVALKGFVDEYDKVIHDQSNMELLKKALAGGQISFITYLQEVHFFHSANSDYLDLLYQYQQALTKLSRYI